MSNKKRKISLVYASKGDVSFKKHRPLHFMIAVYMGTWIILSLNPVNYFEWWYENLASVIVVALLAVAYRKYRLTNSSYACILTLLVLHTMGAHYTYSFCPIGNWLKVFLDFKRNNFDRLVCFAFGLLISIPIKEVLNHRLRVRYIRACVLSGLIALSICALYELYEMYSSLIISPEKALVFLSIQEDKWDCQNDMVMALLGSVVTMGSCIILRLYKNHKIHIVKNETI